MPPHDTLVFCTGYARNEAEWNSRFQHWINWYSPRVPANTFLAIIDDASPYQPPHPAVPVTQADGTDLPETLASPALIRFQDNLGRQGPRAYPGWWRSFLFSVVLARKLGVKRIVHIESDALIFSERLLQWLFEKETGWSTIWTSKYSMPESAIQVICEDSFPLMEELAQGCSSRFNGTLAEHILPFTDIDRSFVGDRYSEMRKNRGIFRSRKFDNIPPFRLPIFGRAIPKGVDFATQVESWQRLPKGTAVRPR